MENASKVSVQSGGSVSYFQNTTPVKWNWKSALALSWLHQIFGSSHVSKFHVMLGLYYSCIFYIWCIAKLQAQISDNVDWRTVWQQRRGALYLRAAGCTESAGSIFNHHHSHEANSCIIAIKLDLDRLYWREELINQFKTFRMFFICYITHRNGDIYGRASVMCTMLHFQYRNYGQRLSLGLTPLSIITCCLLLSWKHPPMCFHFVVDAMAPDALYELISSIAPSMTRAHRPGSVLWAMTQFLHS